MSLGKLSLANLFTPPDYTKNKIKTVTLKKKGDLTADDGIITVSITTTKDSMLKTIISNLHNEFNHSDKFFYSQKWISKNLNVFKIENEYQIQ